MTGKSRADQLVIARRLTVAPALNGALPGACSVLAGRSLIVLFEQDRAVRAGAAGNV